MSRSESDFEIPGVVKFGLGVVAFLVVGLLAWVLFVPPYNRPKFVTIENNQTAFVLPMDPTGDPAVKQVRVSDPNALRDKVVDAKRIQIHRKWQQLGWIYNFGEYMDVERVITVDRTPVQRKWMDGSLGTNKDIDEALMVQTQDGTGLKLNFSCTAYIPESNEKTPEGAEHFLFYYKGDSLAHIMDTEIHQRIQAVASDFASRYEFEKLRGTQHDLVAAVSADVIPFYKEKGILITKLGIIGGFHYVNPDIQVAIDHAIKAQQLRVVAKAQQEKEKVEQETLRLNQAVANQTMLSKADGIAAAKIKEAEGDAKAKLAAANVEAESLKVNAAAEAAAIKVKADAEAYRYGLLDKTKELILALKALDVEKEWRSRWTGAVPTSIIQGVSNGLMPIFPLDITKKAPAAKE